MEEKEIQLTPDEKSLLLRIARESVQAYLEEGVPPAMDTYPLTPLLKQKMGVFVTLRCAGALRGCIGHIFAQKGLAQTVAVNAVNAGFYDSRFAPLRPEELEALRFEVSVLLPAEEESPFIPVNDPGEICIGRDGLSGAPGRPWASFATGAGGAGLEWHRISGRDLPESGRSCRRLAGSWCPALAVSRVCVR